MTARSEPGTLVPRSVRQLVSRRVRQLVSWSLVAALVIEGAGCGRSRAGEQRGAPGSIGTGADAAEIAATTPPALSLALGLAADQRSLDVEIHMTGPDVSKVRALRATRGWADVHPLAAVRDLVVRDALGPIALGPTTDEASFSVMPLARAPAGGEITVRYSARAGAEASRLALHRGEGGVSGIGHSFVVRPAIEVELPLTVRLRGEGGSALASSLDGRLRATPEDLADAVFVAGAVSTDVSTSGDRATIAFGPRVAARAAIEVVTRARAFAARAFGPRAAEARAPVSLFLIGERGIGKEHDGAAAGGSIAVWLDATRGLDDGAKIVLAHEALHAVFGGTIRVDAGGHDAAWFSEGFATHYARRALFDEGLIDADAFLADVARLDEGRAKQADPSDAHAIAYALGARYAAHVDAAARSRSKGKRSLDDVVRALGEETTRRTGAPISTAALRAVITAEVGEADERALWLGLVAGALPELPDGAFGPCFRRTTETRTTVDLGFDPGSLVGRLHIVRGTIEGSAAARAGVRDGALVLESNVRPGAELSETSTVELLLSDPRGKKRVRYRPLQKSKHSVFKPRPCQR